MIQRRTQTAAYWQQEFTLSRKDVQYLYGLVLDGGRPMNEALLARQLMERHVKQEEEAIRAELMKAGNPDYAGLRELFKIHFGPFDRVVFDQGLRKIGLDG